MTTSDSVTALIPALTKARGAMAKIVKDSTATIPGKSGGSGYKYTYAALGDVLDSVMPALRDNDLMLIQGAEGEGGFIVVETMLVHGPSGEWLRSRLPMKPNGSDPQSVGSAITYGRRYGLLPMLGLAAEDDDGAAASHKGNAPRAAATAAAPTPAANGKADAPATPPAPRIDPKTMQRAVELGHRLAIIPDETPPADAKRLLRKWAYENGVCGDDIRTGFTPEHAAAIVKALESLAEHEGVAVPPPPVGWKMSGAQRGRLMAMHSECGHDDDDRHAIYENLTGKTSSSAFSRDDLNKVFKALEAEIEMRSAPV